MIVRQVHEEQKGKPGLDDRQEHHASEHLRGGNTGVRDHKLQGRDPKDNQVNRKVSPCVAPGSFGDGHNFAPTFLSV
jgi:hypothetical protein